MRLAGRLASLAIAFLMVAPAFAISAAADGHSSIHYPGTDSWTSLNERSQYCIVSHHDGAEQMIMAIEINRNSLVSGSQIFWIFPIPADPSASHIGLLPKITKLNGEPLSDHMNATLRSDFAFIYASQIYAIPFSIALALPTDEYSDGTQHLGFGGTGSGGISDVTVVEHVEGGGLATELLSTEDSSALSAYLAQKDLVLSSELSSLISDYIGDDYCFVVSWVADAELLMALHPIDYSDYLTSDSFSVGVSVSFPTDKVFFPLKLTKAYGSQSIPIKVDVLGLIDPPDLGAFPDSMNVQTTYRVDPDFTFNQSMTYFFTDAFGADADDGNLRNVEYTEFRITGPASSFNDDLFFESTTPSSVSGYLFMENYHWIFIIMLFAGASCLASLLSGMFTFRHCHPAKVKFAALGLFNLLTLIAVLIATSRFKIDSRFADPQREEEVENRRAWFLINFMWMFLVLSIIVQAIFVFAVPSMYAT